MLLPAQLKSNRCIIVRNAADPTWPRTWCRLRCRNLRFRNNGSNPRRR